MAQHTDSAHPFRSQEDAATVLCAAAMEVDNAADRVARRAEELHRRGGDTKFCRAAEQAAAQLVEVAKVLRRDGLLGPRPE